LANWTEGPHEGPILSRQCDRIGPMRTPWITEQTETSYREVAVKRAALDRAAAELTDAIQAARRAGLPVRRIAEAAGTNRTSYNNRRFTVKIDC